MNAKQASCKALLKLSIPLMMTWVSTTIMMFADRLLLSFYSLEALGAAINAGMLAWGFAYGFQIFTEMSQVIVAQYKGSNQESKMTEPVWQMLWMTLFSVAIFAALGLFGSQCFFTKGSLQYEYFRYLIFFGPAFGLIGASSAYFIGKGETKVVTWSAVLGNVINIVLDWILIFGIQGFIPSLGIRGAAIATGIGMSVQALCLLLLFFKKTGFTPKFLNLKSLKSCFKVGVPNGVFMCMELLSWGIFYTILAKTSQKHLLVTSMCQSLMPLFASVSIGLQKGIASMSGLFIGAEKLENITKLLRSGLIIATCYFLGLAIFLFFFPNVVISLFLVLNKNQTDQQTILQLMDTLKIGLLLSCGYLFFGGLRSLITGVLSAAGDSKFLIVAGVLSVWMLLIFPSYIFIFKNKHSVTIAQSILMLYGLCCAIIYYLRYRCNGWKKNSLLVEKTNLPEWSQD